MGTRSWPFVLFSLCLFFSSGLCTARMVRDEENNEISSTEFSSQLDAVPIFNPTTPGTGNPSTSNPTTPQAPYMTGPTPTIPNTNPTTPTTPNTSPTPPTTPNTSPTPPTSTTTPTTPANPTMTPPTPTTTAPASGSGQWCVASQTASEKALKVALDYACGYGADCSAIQPGGSCYNPNTLRDHASYAFNEYYQKNPAPTSCAFGGTATLINTDPSNGNCHYPSSRAQSMSQPTNGTPPNMASPMTPTTPTMTPTTPGMSPTTPSTTIPGGSSTVFGSGPTGSPNIATSASHPLMLLFTTCGLWATIHVANYI